MPKLAVFATTLAGKEGMVVELPDGVDSQQKPIHTKATSMLQSLGVPLFFSGSWNKSIPRERGEKALACAEKVQRCPEC